MSSERERQANGDGAARRLNELRAELTDMIPEDSAPDEVGVAAIIAQGATAVLPVVAWEGLEGPARHAQCVLAAREGDRSARRDLSLFRQFRRRALRRADRRHKAGLGRWSRT